MGCDIHIISEVKKDGKWMQLKEPLPGYFTSRNYALFAALSSVRDYFQTFGFESKGLPEDLSAKKFNFESCSDRAKERYENEGAVYCVTDEGYLDTFDSSLRCEISKEEYENRENADLKYKRNFGWSMSGDEKTYLCSNARAFDENAYFEEVPYKMVYPTFKEFLDRYYAEDWDDDAGDYGLWDVNFDCEDYHSASYLTLKELEEHDWHYYYSRVYKIPKSLVAALEEKGCKLPFETKELESYGDLFEAIREGVDPSVCVYVPMSEEETKNLALYKIIDFLKDQKEKTEADDIRIVFAFDN